MNIYVASSWKNNYQPEVVNILRSEGHEVYDFKNPPHGGLCNWNLVDSDYQNWNTESFAKAMNTKAADFFFNSDFEAMKAADACVLVLPCGRSAHSEAGWFAGQGKPVYVFIPDFDEPELMYKMFTLITSDMWKIVEALSKPLPVAPNSIHSVPEAMKVVINLMKNDENYYDSWKANIAVCMQDAYADHIRGQEHVTIDRMSIHEISNNGARRFLEILSIVPTKVE